MIVYHPVNDVYHCLYRMLLILENIPLEDIELERLQLLDFFLTFPSLLKNISFPIGIKGARKAVSSIPETYETISNPRRIMFEMGNIQLEGVVSLAAKGLIDKDKLANGIVARTKVELPSEIVNAFSNDKTITLPWFTLLTQELSQIDFGGEKGFKARSGLMEYRYDI